MPPLASRLLAPAVAVAVPLLAAAVIAAARDDAARPEWTDQQAAELAAELRAAYSQPPEQWPDAVVDEGVAFVELGLIPDPPHPDDNPPNKAKIALGEMLFFDPRLSSSNQIACASCHDPDLGWADGRTVSFGHRRTELKRNAPTVQNTGHFEHLFWDSRTDSLEALTIEVIENQNELRSDRRELEAKLSKITGYAEHFAAAFGSEGVTIERIAMAVAAFVRDNQGGRSRFDAFLRGRTDALSDAAIRGLHLFRTDARCMNCHHGPLMSDGLLHNTGLNNLGRPFEDLGRYEVTHDPDDVGKFKTPQLRNIERTAPYMHHGLFPDLETVVRAYNIGMPSPRPTDDPRGLESVKSPLLHRLDLNDRELADLVAFLESLSEPRIVTRPPDLPED